MVPMFLLSKENNSLDDILRPGQATVLRICHWNRGNFWKKLFVETLELSDSEWRAFAGDTFRDRGCPVPDWPPFVEIQEGLGLCGRSLFERTLRKLKRTAQKELNVLWDEFCESWWKSWKGQKDGRLDRIEIFWDFLMRDKFSASLSHRRQLRAMYSLYCFYIH